MSRRLALAVVACAAVALVLLAAPAAEACCIPCAGFCTKTTPPETVCCTGIPVPGDACGHTTCGKYLCGKRCEAAIDFAVAALDATPATPASCPETVPPFLAPAGEAPAAEPAE